MSDDIRDEIRRLRHCATIAWETAQTETVAAEKARLLRVSAYLEEKASLLERRIRNEAAKA